MNEYHNEDNLNSKQLVCEVIVRLCRKWGEEHAGELTGREVAQRHLVDGLEAKSHREATKLLAQLSYVESFAGQGSNPMKAVGMSKTSALGPAKELASGKAAPSLMTGNPEEAERIKKGAELAHKYGLTEAEVAAIRTYTLGDYTLYINPAAAQNEERLAENIEIAKQKGGLGFDPNVGQDVLKEEGQVHAAVMTAGLAKLPEWEGVLYRGERRDFVDVVDDYASTSYTYLSVGSASKSQKKALEYAQGTQGREPKPHQNVHVLVVLHVKYGRDINPIGRFVKGEVTILPGAKFTIDDVTKLERGPRATQRCRRNHGSSSG